MEATGRFNRNLAKYLFAAGHDVRIVNGKRIRRFAEALGLLDKTDRADAHAIAEFILNCESKTRPWSAPPLAREQLADVRSHIVDLQKSIRQYENRLQSGIEYAPVLESYRTILAVLYEELRKADAKAGEIIAADQSLTKAKKAMMQQIGVGEITSTTLLARIDFHSFERARQVARFAGLTPKREQSGTSIKRNGRISKEGPPDVRAVLYMAAGSAMQHDPAMSAFAERARANGKLGAKIRIAIMRKILVRCWALVVRGAPFNPEHVPAAFAR
jgi:transposase